MNKNILLVALLMILSSPILGNNEEHDDLILPQKVIDYCNILERENDLSCLSLIDDEHTLADDEFVYEIISGIDIHGDHDHNSVESEQLLKPMLEQQIQSSDAFDRGKSIIDQTRFLRQLLQELDTEEFRKFKKEHVRPIKNK